MELFRRHKPIKPENTVPPAEPAMAGPAAEAAIRALDEKVFVAWRTGDLVHMDALLDRRNRIRAPRPSSVPVVPGRST